MVLLLRKRHLLTVVAAAALCGALLLTARPGAAAVSGSASPQRAVILDAGHGGADGGAVSDSGVAESGINLQITRRLYEILRLLGHPSVMTRSGDEAIYDDTAVTLREKKVSDLKNRTALANGTPDGLLISIHQNSMPDHPSVHGAQVFYNAVSPGGELGMAVQGALNGAVNAGNEKNARAIDSTIYLMKNVRCPAILIECGFLSNPAETRLLLTDEYQVKLAACIAAGLLQYHTEGAKA